MQRSLKVVQSKVSNHKKMIIKSASFHDNGKIPDKYGCLGKGISPQLSWSDYPAETKSFSLVCHDPDSPGGNFIHWLIANIPSNISSISEGEMLDKVESLPNDFGNIGYGGPCPASGEHHYVFTIYALNTHKIEKLNKDNFLEKINPYIIDSAKITGLYKK